MPKLEEELQKEQQPKDLKSQIKAIEEKIGWSFKKEGNKLETIKSDKEQKKAKKDKFNEVDKSVISSLLKDDQGINKIVDLFISKVTGDRQKITKEVTTNTSDRDKNITTYISYFSINFSHIELASLIKSTLDPATIDKIQKLLDEKNQKAANIFKLAKSLEIIGEEAKKQHKEGCLSEKTANNFLKLLLDITSPEALNGLLFNTMTDKDFHSLHMKEIEVLEKAALNNPDTFYEKFINRPEDNHHSLEVIKQNIALIRLLQAYESENKASNLLLKKSPNLCLVLGKLDSNSLSASRKTVTHNYNKIIASNLMVIKEDYCRQILQNKHQIKHHGRQR
jgi:heme oxygenase